MLFKRRGARNGLVDSSALGWINNNPYMTGHVDPVTFDPVTGLEVRLMCNNRARNQWPSNNPTNVHAALLARVHQCLH